MVHEQKFEDLLSSTCQVSVESVVTECSVERDGSTAMLATKRLAGVTPEVNLREHVI